MKKDETYNIKCTRFFLDDLYGPDDYNKDYNNDFNLLDAGWFGNTISEIKFNMIHNPPSYLERFDMPKKGDDDHPFIQRDTYKAYKFFLKEHWYTAKDSVMDADSNEFLGGLV